MEQTQQWAQRVLEFTADKPVFREWLLEKHGYSPERFRLLCMATGTLKDYYRGMDWYRIRYEKEMQLREKLINNNPFEGGN